MELALLFSTNEQKITWFKRSKHVVYYITLNYYFVVASSIVPLCKLIIMEKHSISRRITLLSSLVILDVIEHTLSE